MRSLEPSLTAMISNVSAIDGSVSSASVDEPLEVRLLVVGREEVRQARHPRRRGPRRGVAAGAVMAGLLAARDAVEVARAADGLEQ